MSEIARVVQVAAANRNGPKLEVVDPDGQAVDVLDQITALLGLPAVGLRITGVDVFGYGSNAIAHLHLSNGRRIELEPLGKFGSPSKLTIELAIQVGATPTLKSAMVATVMALIHRAAVHHETMARTTIVAEWGLDFLQTAKRHAVDMSNQLDRWQAFQLLKDTDPITRSRADGTSVAAESVVLDDVTGVRYVRCGWLLAFVRASVGPYASDALARDMQSVGWRRPGGQGRVKATSPALTDSLVWTFYTVPKGWEEGVCGEPVNAGSSSRAREAHTDPAHALESSPAFTAEERR